MIHRVASEHTLAEEEEMMGACARMKARATPRFWKCYAKLPQPVLSTWTISVFEDFRII